MRTTLSQSQVGSEQRAECGDFGALSFSTLSMATPSSTHFRLSVRLGREKPKQQEHEALLQSQDPEQNGALGGHREGGTGCLPPCIHPNSLESAGTQDSGDLYLSNNNTMRVTSSLDRCQCLFLAILILLVKVVANHTDSRAFWIAWYLLKIGYFWHSRI